MTGEIIAVKINSQAARSILKSDAVKADLLARAERIKKRAGDTGYAVDARNSPNRSRVEVAAVTRAAITRESQQGTLRRAVGG